MLKIMKISYAILYEDTWLGQVLLSNSSTVCRKWFHLHNRLFALIIRWSVILKIISTLVLGLCPIDVPHTWACKILGKYCPLHFILTKVGVIFCSLGEGWDHGYGRPWSTQDSHSEIIWQGFCYLVTAPHTEPHTEPGLSPCSWFGSFLMD